MAYTTTSSSSEIPFKLTLNLAISGMAVCAQQDQAVGPDLQALRSPPVKPALPSRVRDRATYAAYSHPSQVFQAIDICSAPLHSLQILQAAFCIGATRQAKASITWRHVMSAAAYHQISLNIQLASKQPLKNFDIRFTGLTLIHAVPGKCMQHTRQQLNR